MSESQKTGKRIATQAAKASIASPFERELHDRLSEFNSAPILFVGAGLSRRYLGLPSWHELLAKLASLTGKDYAFYLSGADGNLPAVASALVGPLGELIWKPEYEAVLAANKAELSRKDSALKVFTANEVAGLKLSKNADLARELDLLKDAVVDAVITTNYDSLMERIFGNFEVFVGQDELVFSDTLGVGEIYKIHGSVTSPNSLVITESDYENYAERNSYLAAKLLTMFAEHPVVFLGYSMSDPNVTQILDSLVSCLRPEHVQKLQDRLFFVEWKPGEKPSVSNTVIPIRGTNLPVIRVAVPEFQGIFRVLGQLQRKFPAHMLRRLKDRVYDLILTNDPQGQLYVTTDLEKEAGGPDVVIGVGAITDFGKQGYTGLSRLDLVRDVIFQRKRFEAEKVVIHALPDLLAHAGNLPYMGYLVAAGFVDENGNLKDRDELDPRVVAHFEKGATPYLPSESMKKSSQLRAARAGTFTKLVADNEYADVLTSIGSLQPEKINVEELREFLASNYKRATIPGGKLESQYAKAAGLYDRLISYPAKAW